MVFVSLSLSLPLFSSFLLLFVCVSSWVVLFYYQMLFLKKGIDEAVQQMKVGQVADVTLLPDKAFGSKGRRASPGKPAIPPNATVSYTIELSTIPGKDEELLETLDDTEIGTSL